MHSADDEKTAVEDADGRRVPPRLDQMEGCRVLEESAAVTGRRGTRFEDTESLGAVLDGGVAREAVRIASETHLSRYVR